MVRFVQLLIEFDKGAVVRWRKARYRRFTATVIQYLVRLYLHRSAVFSKLTIYVQIGRDCFGLIARRYIDRNAVDVPESPVFHKIIMPHGVLGQAVGTLVKKIGRNE